MKVSMIIPTWNEEGVIGESLETLFREQNPEEVLVVDGGSKDGTVREAQAWAPVLRSPKGRAAQMNAGAKQVRGDILLFLHADTRLPANALSQIKAAIQAGHSAGRFRMRFKEAHPLLRLYEFYTRFQFFSYGDQAFFVTRQVFDALAGYREDVPFEDLDFYRRLREGHKPVILRDPVMTSARRFENVGMLRQKWINLKLVSMYYLGLDVSRAKEKMYADVR